jgi:ubiquinone biosynthesis O-methyltransferase
MKPDRSLHDVEEERAVPWGEPGLFAWHRARYEFSLAFVGGLRVLDVGCGEGYGAALLAERARDVVGIDYSPAAIDHARRTYAAPNLRFEVVDATDLPAQAEAFDVVTCFEVIEHIQNGDALIAGIAESLTPNGVLVLSTPNAIVDEAFAKIAHRERYEYHVNMLTPRELRRLIEKRFGRVQLYGQSVKGNTLHHALKMVDIFNLRHRLIRSARTQEAIRMNIVRTAVPDDASQLRFRVSRLLVRQSPHVLVVARAPLRMRRPGG